MDVGPHQLGKWLVLLGLAITLAGLLVMALARFGLFRLPGDFEFAGRHWRVYIPLATSVLLSLLLTLLFWLLRRFRP